MRALFRILSFSAVFFCFGAHADAEPVFIERDRVSNVAHETAINAYRIGTNFMHENRLAEAEENLLAAIDLAPDFVDALDHLGIVYRKQQEYPKAEKVYLRSIEINPGNTVPYINLALVYRLQNKTGQAIQVYEDIMRRFPEDPESYYGLGLIYSQENDHEKSAGYLDKAIEKYQAMDSPYIYHAFAAQAENYHAMQENEKALLYYMKLSSAYPDEQYFKERIKELEKPRP
ncbi:MAG: tetratricopeptide repeat protein [Zoogloeaceae bacterium]|jgi:tetratricopeptide (TPR) repeat protein|nr:tetratricopeptide repeat protein [Zoogloeaceae bacterium]